MKRALTTAVLVSVCAFGSNSADASNLLMNSSFEEPLLSPNTSSVVVPALWTATSPPSLHNGVPGAGFPSPQDGQQSIAMGVEGNGSPNAITQGFAVSNASLFRLSWYDNTLEASDGTSPYTVLVNDASNQEVASATYDAFNGTLGWENQVLDLQLGIGNYSVTFRPDTPSGALVTFVDNVSLSAIPEPTSMVLAFIMLVTSLSVGRHLSCH